MIRKDLGRLGGASVSAVEALDDGTDVKGQVYLVLDGPPSARKIQFQRGDPANGVNGITDETLLQVLIHRTEFLNSSSPLEENRLALISLKAALASFQQRTASRGIDGKGLTALIQKQQP